MHTDGRQVLCNVRLPSPAKDVELDLVVDCCDYHTMCPVNRRVRDKYEAELKEVERSEKSTLEKYNAMKVSSMSAVICATTTGGVLHLCRSANTCTDNLDAYVVAVLYVKCVQFVELINQ